MHVFVVPPLAGPPTGGTVYNRHLTTALVELGAEVNVLSIDDAAAAIAEPRPRRFWIDSLYLDRFGQLDARRHHQAELHLLAHYLPTLVARGERPGVSALSADEAASLSLARGFLTPSRYLADELTGLGVERRRIIVVEPAAEAPDPDADRPLDAGRERTMRALMVANLVDGKGILPFLREFARLLQRRDDLELTIVGGSDHEPDYARACMELVASSPLLRRRVAFAGPLAHARCMALMANSDVLVSASRMESYGMALADARACGLPIIARGGGNIAAHLDPGWGGELVADEAAVARACIALARDRDDLARRRARARSSRPVRSWATAAHEFITATTTRTSGRTRR